ncbi:MAG: hypothetical protein ACREL5_09255 [Gemmatimonadales bacterium]
MSKQRDAQLAKLVRKLGTNPPKPAKVLRRQYDKTLPPAPDDTRDAQDTEAFFAEMKKREF